MDEQKIEYKYLLKNGSDSKKQEKIDVKQSHSNRCGKMHNARASFIVRRVGKGFGRSLETDGCIDIFERVSAGERATCTRPRPPLQRWTTRNFGRLPKKRLLPLLLASLALELTCQARVLLLRRRLRHHRQSCGAVCLSHARGTYSVVLGTPGSGRGPGTGAPMQSG